MKKYRIEIWQFHSITATYESDDIVDVLTWFKGNWYWVYDDGHCAFYVYRDGHEEINFDELCDLGFYD